MSLVDISTKFDNETLDHIIKNVGGQKCTNWHFSGEGFKKGDSYLSEVYKLHLEDNNIEDSKIEANLVIKCIPKNIGRRKTFRSADFFRNEFNFYTKVFSELMIFQASKKPKCQFTEITQYIVGYSDGENDFIAMDDLGIQGYRTMPRENSIGFDECSFCMKTLGRFHALSFAMKDQEPKKFEEISQNLEETYYGAKHKEWYNNFLQQQIVTALDAVQREYGDTEIEKKAKQFFDCDFYDKMVSLTSANGKNAVITHGDCWMPNFLFKFDNQNKPTFCKILDFQLARLASVALDLSFFFYSCTHQSLREKHYDELLKIYHESLSELVRDLGSDPEKVFPYSEFLDEMKNFGQFGIGMGIESIPFSLMGDDEVADLDLIKGEDAVPIDTIWSIKPIKTQEGRRRLADCFKHGVEYMYIP